jgi:hypothetical protein
MTESNQYGLPRDLGDGLLLRWAKPEDAEELGQFNVRIHSENPDEPETSLAHWTRDLMNGRHPTTQASDFTVVIDQKTGKIVSSLNLISQTWTYDGIEFGVGRPELVGTDAAYRRRGLVRAQFEAIHAKSAARDEMVQAITGIPWYYRLFDYDMALDLGGSRQFFWHRKGNHKPVKEEMYRLRPAAVDDIPLLGELYAANCQRSRISRVRDEQLWLYELTEPHQESPYGRHMHIVETTDGNGVAYIEYFENPQWGSGFVVRELGVLPGHSWRAVGLFLTRALKAQADALNREREKPIDAISFNLGLDHPIYEALGSQLERQIPAYAWYIRVPDLPGFIWHIAPILEKRLAASVMAGHCGTVRLNFYHSQMTLVFADGKLQGIGTYQPNNTYDGDALFPDLTFLQLLFGYRSLDELDHARADCGAENVETAVLLNILFPKQHSCVVGLG